MQLRYSQIIASGRIPEANIQAEFYRACRANGIKVLLEITYENCRFDALVFHNDKPLAIVEVKNYSKRTQIRGLSPKGRQMKKYSKYDIPIFGVLATSYIGPTIDKILTLIQSKTNGQNQE